MVRLLRGKSDGRVSGTNNLFIYFFFPFFTPAFLHVPMHVCSARAPMRLRRYAERVVCSLCSAARTQTGGVRRKLGEERWLLSLSAGGESAGIALHAAAGVVGRRAMLW